MYGISEDVRITESLILNYLTEKQIIEHYLGIPVVFGKILKSPLRYDKKPTASFYYDSRGKLVFKDFGNGFHGDFVQVVQQKYSLNYYSALERIYNELVNGKQLDIIPEEDRIQYVQKKKIIQVKRRPLDLDYWSEFGISKETLELYRVSGLQTLWINGKIVYSYSMFDPGHLYEFQDSMYKAYFPFRDSYRFLSNTTQYIIQGYDQLPKKGKLLIVTKALKDVMCLHELGYDAIAPQAESVLISANQILELKSRFKRIVSLMDFDYAGVMMMNKMKRKYNIAPYTLTNGRFYTPDYGAKDISDLIKLIGPEEVKKLMLSK